MKRLLIIIGITAIAVVGTVAATSMGNRSGGEQGKQQQSSEATKPVGENAVAMQGYAFAPEKMTVKKGTTVTWENRDDTRHNVVSEDDSPVKGLNGPLIKQGESWSHTFTQTGTYTYYCSPHPYMKATVEVTE